MSHNLRVDPTPESPEIGKGGWLGTAEFAAVQPTVHVDINVTVPARRVESPPGL